MVVHMDLESLALKLVNTHGFTLLLVSMWQHTHSIVRQ